MLRLLGRVAVLLLVAQGSLALPLLARFTGTATGAIGGNSFSNTPFAIDAGYDSDTAVLTTILLPSGPVDVYIALTPNAMITIGASTASFGIPTLVFFNPGTQGVGFRAALDPVTNPAFAADFLGISCTTPCAGWQLDTPLAPVFDAAPRNRFQNIPTDLGALNLTVAGAATFEVIAVPEPSTACLLACGLLAFAGRRRSRR